MPLNTTDHFKSNIEVELRNVCRVCLQVLNDGMDLSNEDENSRKALEKIYLCFQIIITFDKYLPCRICENCMMELNIAFNFRLKCISFEERFEDYIKQLSNSTTVSTQQDDAKNEADDAYVETNDPDSPNIPYETDILSVSTSNKYLFGNQQEHSFMCEICNKILKSKASLLKHNISMHQKRKHIGNVTGFGSARRYHCTSCTYSTPHSQTLVNHMRRHDGERPYRCDCGKSFTQSSSLAAHQKTHSNTTYFTCSVCGKQFKHAFTLKNHLRVHENGNLTCDLCQKVLKSKQSLKDHMLRHYNIRNYNCEDCGNTFVTSSELLNHRKKHVSEKTIECHLCGYKTHTKKNLVIHLKRHAGDKMFKCNMCEVTFYTGGDLRRHRRVHTREKPFSCPTCAQRFTHSPSLNKHMQMVHGIHYKWGDFKWKEIRKLKSVTKQATL